MSLVNKHNIPSKLWMSKVEEEIDNQESSIPPKRKKTKEDKEFEEVEVESTGGGFNAGGEASYTN
jgi:hypothetical protein